MSDEPNVRIRLSERERRSDGGLSGRRCRSLVASLPAWPPATGTYRLRHWATDLTEISAQHGRLVVYVRIRDVTAPRALYINYTKNRTSMTAPTSTMRPHISPASRAARRSPTAATQRLKSLTFDRLPLVLHIFQVTLCSFSRFSLSSFLSFALHSFTGRPSVCAEKA